MEDSPLKQEAIKPTTRDEQHRKLGEMVHSTEIGTISESGGNWDILLHIRWSVMS